MVIDDETRSLIEMEIETRTNQARQEEREKVARYVADILDAAGMNGESMAKAIRAMPEETHDVKG